MNEVIDTEVVETAEDTEIRKSYEAIAEAEKKVELAKAYSELVELPQYKLVIADGFLTDEPARIFKNLVEPSFLTREERADFVDDITAVSKLNGYLLGIESQAHAATRTIINEQERIAELENGGKL